MKKNILFLHPNKANLPELEAYNNYFSKNYNVHISDNYNQDVSKYDIIWIIMGTKSVKKSNINQILIHEYASLSVGKFSRFKNIIKKRIVGKPDLRIFLNKFVQEELNFKDHIRYCYRDMGISENFVVETISNYEIPKYEFVYVGDISKERKMDKFLNAYTKKYSKKLLLIGKYDKNIYYEYSKFKNITFLGKIPYEDVPKKIKNAVYAINFIPDKYPYNIQTSTKLQEYVALGMKVITTPGKWVEKFEKKNNCNFYYIDHGSNIFGEDYKNFNYLSNLDGQSYFWDNIINNSRIIENINLIHKGNV